MRRLLCVLLLLLPLPLCAQNPATVGPVVTTPHLKYGRPGAGLPDMTLIARRGYACLHSATTKTPLWVSYRLTRKNLEKSVPRKDAFKADKDLMPGFRAEKEDYKNSGFERGHMAPCEDMSRDDPTLKESFYLSNMVPQNPSNDSQFWKALEKRFRDYATKYGEVVIITGPIYGKPLPPGSQPLQETIGDNHVSVPTWLFRIAVRKLPGGGYHAIAIEAPNLPIPAGAGGYEGVFKRMLASIDQVEADSGFNFLNALPVSVQDQIESKVPVSLWPLRN